MASPYTHKKLTDVEDSAPKFGFGELQEARFAKRDLETEQTGLSYHRVRPGRRQGFGHRHDQAEEVYVVIAGSGRMKLDDDIIDVESLHAIRVAPGVARAFEAGPDGLEVIAFGPRRDDDRGELLPGWWADSG
jgi:mannose-6-phosphate isomerase-like protein (cupin superfamily)